MFMRYMKTADVGAQALKALSHIEYAFPKKMVRAKKDCHAFIPLSIPQFMHYCDLAHHTYRVVKNFTKQPRLGNGVARTKFLDVGCGIGVKLVIASQWFDDADGIEIHEKYAERAKAISVASKIFNTDARRWRGYANYDVIYFYCPMCNYIEEEKMERHIFKMAKPNAIIIGLGHLLQGLNSKFPGVTAVSQQIGVKTESPKLLKAIEESKPEFGTSSKSS